MFSVPVLSWALYDFANTIFSLSIGSLYFTTWIITDRNNPDWYLSAMTSGVLVMLLVTVPTTGALADRLGRRKPFLLFFTALCICATALLATVDSTLWALAVAGIATFGFQSALGHYDPMLANVAPPEYHGRVSGLGVGVGYVGSFVALAAIPLFIHGGDKQDAFLPTAILYLLFALPIFLFVREPRVEHDKVDVGRVARESMRELALTIRKLGEYRDILRLLTARFLYVDALAVVIAVMGIYLGRLGFSDGEVRGVLALSIVFAAVGAIVAGHMVERHGPRAVLTFILIGFSSAMLLQAATGSAALMWVLGPVVGIGLGSVWASDRVFMLRLAPPPLRGEFFGLHNLVGKASSALGPGLWGGTIYLLYDRTEVLSKVGASRVAIAILAVVALAGMLIVRTLDDSPRSFDDDPVAAELEAGGAS